MIDTPFHDPAIVVIQCGMLIVVDSRVTASELILLLQKPAEERKKVKGS